MLAMMAIAGALLTIAAGLAAAAATATSTIFGIPAAIVLILLAAAVAILAALFALFALFASAQLKIQQDELQRERARFSDDVAKVTMACPQSCWGDTTVPSCPGE